MTIAKVFKNSSLPLVETEILLAAALNKDRSFIKSFPETILSRTEKYKTIKFIDRRLKHEPISYILGFKEFYGLKFLVNENVLIPRPETENLVEQILKFSANRNLTIIDVGTGSGCIAIALAVKNPRLTIIATDISQQALKVAKKNAKFHQVENQVKFIQSDLLAKVSQKVDIIAANLPYIPTRNWTNLPVEIKNYEPRLALDSGKSSTNLYHKLFQQSLKQLKPNGTIFYEIDGDIIQVSADDLVEIPLE